MKTQKTTIQKGILKIIKQVKNSTNGNPRFIIQIGDNKPMITKADVMGYEINNKSGRNVEVETRVLYGKVMATDWA
ncbi:hypothetical protein AV947_gp03 [Podophage Lau218]|uniref:Putative phage protein n=2 Tax=Lauvirus lau218 TaxID=1465639 RepID=A0A060BRN0_9CAUD|nr:hypothetical protein AV947_gp03 [Podophage Lau218]AIA83118.1 putative phage protein [Podophage Lau218]AIA83166.1 putative phage protein [Lauvirus lau218]AIA83214.1 putative phage protein [Lauvirus lau218]